MLSEEQAIEKLKKIREDTIKANECGLSNNDFKEEIEVYDTVLNRITKLQKENEEKDKQIDYIIDFIRERSIYAVDTHEKLKQYFEIKAKQEQ